MAVRVPDVRTARVDSAIINAQLAVTVASADVRFELHVANTGGKRAEVQFPSGYTHDFVVLDSTGREVWRWAKGRLFTQTVQNRHLKSGDSFRFAERWADAAPGTYTVIATLRSANYPVEERSAFVLR